uniref:GBF-interacting protein 1 N-terminal domain-containing protein n=1 Tax=Anthurium amnicola TaxID=1678845 RepID=A0A1D1YWA7_9ARAE
MQVPGLLLSQKKLVDHPVQWTKSRTSWDWNSQRGSFAKNPSPDAGINREFRVVRDNRVNQSNNKDLKSETPQHSVSGNEARTSLPEKSSSGALDNDKLSTVRTEGKSSSQGFIMPSKTVEHAKITDVNGMSRRTALDAGATITKSSLQAQKGFGLAHNAATMAASSSSSGMYASSSDPVHVPSPDSRSAGTVGAFRREVGVVGGRRQSAEHPASHSSFSNNSFSLPVLGKDISTATDSVGHSKGSQLNQTLASEPFIPVSRPFSSHQYNNKLHQQPLGHQKASQPNMEWRPKSSQKSNNASSGAETGPASPHADNSTSSKVEVAALSDKLSDANIFDSKHVIIPQHLRVPEAERAGLTFGSFGSGFDSTKDFTSAFQAYENLEAATIEPSVSTSTSFPVGSSEDLSLGDQADLADGQAKTSRSGSPGSAAQSEQPNAENNDSSSPRNADDFADIGLVQRHSPSYSSSEQQQMQNPPSLATFSEPYDPQPSYDMPFFGSAMDDNVHGQRLASPPEVLVSHIANSSPVSTMAMVQQQTLSQQQPVLYPQVHISHFPNFVPYRQFLSPLYVPPMAMPNYSSNPAYPHPSSGSSYLLMPGGSSHLTAGGMKYATSQYKPVPAGNPTAYGNYNSPSGYAMSAPGTLAGASGLDDVSRIKYKDNSLYVPNPQAEASEIWIQTPRDLPNMHSPTPFYNLSGQAPHPAYLPTPTGHASFNAAAQSSHVQFPGLYHPPQPATIANPHHLVHQQVPPAVGGNVGVGVAAPATQVGSYQQPQVSHLNWTGNF